MLDNDILRKSNLSDLVVQKITTAIGRGELKSGDRLPSHDELCKRWGTSRTTIREALNKLESAGILTKYQGRGTFINEITPDKMMSTAKLHTLLDKEGIIYLLEARLLIEPAIAELSALRKTEAELEILAQLMEELEQARKKHNHLQFAEADHQLHLFIGKMSKNPFLEVMMRNISKPLALQQMEVISLDEDEQTKISAESQRYHGRIVEAIREGNPEKARTNMVVHLQGISSFMKKNL